MQEDVKEFLENFDIADNALQMRCLNRWNGRDLREKENLAEHTHLVCACSIKLYDCFIVKNEELKNKIDFEYMIRLAMLHDSLELLRGDILSVTKDKVNGLRKEIDDEEELFESHIIGKKDEITAEVVHLADLMACYKFIEYELRFPSGDFSTQVYKSTKRKFDEEYESFCKKYNIPIYANKKTWEAMPEKKAKISNENIRYFTNNKVFSLNDLNTFLNIRVNSLSYEIDSKL